MPSPYFPVRVLYLVPILYPVRSPQSAVRSPQSAVRSPCFILTACTMLGVGILHYQQVLFWLFWLQWGDDKKR